MQNDHTLRGRITKKRLRGRGRIKELLVDVCTCTSRSQWSTGSTYDLRCDGTQVQISPREVVFITTATVIYSLGHGLHALTAVPRSTQPFNLHGTVKSASAFWPSNTNKWRWWMWKAATYSRVTDQVGWLGLRVAASTLSLHSSNEPCGPSNHQTVTGDNKFDSVPHKRSSSQPPLVAEPTGQSGQLTATFCTQGANTVAYRTTFLPPN